MRHRVIGSLACACLVLSLAAAGLARADDDPGRPPDISGKITEIAQGGNTISLGDRKKVVVTVARDTKVIYAKTKGRRRMQVGQQVDIWLQEGTYTAIQINVH